MVLPTLRPEPTGVDDMQVIMPSRGSCKVWPEPERSFQHTCIGPAQLQCTGLHCSQMCPSSCMPMPLQPPMPRHADTCACHACYGHMRDGAPRTAVPSVHRRYPHAMAMHTVHVATPGERNHPHTRAVMLTLRAHAHICTHLCACAQRVSITPALESAIAPHAYTHQPHIPHVVSGIHTKNISDSLERCGPVIGTLVLALFAPLLPQAACS